MLDFAGIDVAIGLVFLFFMLSLICSAINELIASGLRWRSAMLAEGIENLLSGRNHVTAEGRSVARAVHEHPLIQALVRPGSHGWPSYVPSRTFVTALLSLGRVPGEMAIATRSIQESIEAIPNEHTRDALNGILQRAGGDARRFEALAQEWFDDAMERVSGWYRRKIQTALIVIATALVLALNVDTLQVARHLWNDESARAVAVATATQSTETGTTTCSTPAECNRLVSERLESLDSLEIPLGWRGANHGRWEEWTWYPTKLVGLIVTVAALTMGAPFWFDVLSKFGRLRATGAPPPTTDAVRVGEGEEKRAGPTASAAPDEPH